MKKWIALPLLALFLVTAPLFAGGYHGVGAGYGNVGFGHGYQVAVGSYFVPATPVVSLATVQVPTINYQSSQYSTVASLPVPAAAPVNDCQACLPPVAAPVNQCMSASYAPVGIPASYSVGNTAGYVGTGYGYSRNVGTGFGVGYGHNVGVGFNSRYSVGRVGVGHVGHGVGVVGNHVGFTRSRSVSVAVGPVVAAPVAVSATVTRGLFGRTVVRTATVGGPSAVSATVVRGPLGFRRAVQVNVVR